MEKNLIPNVEAEEQTKEPVNGFNAYMEIYGEEELIAKVFGFFVGNPYELSDKSIAEIKTFLLIKSGLPRSEITHTVFEIIPDKHNSYIIDYFCDSDDEEENE